MLKVMQTRDHAITATSGANHNIRIVIIWDEECGAGHVLKTTNPRIFLFRDDVWEAVHRQANRINKTSICDRKEDLGKGTISASVAGLQEHTGRRACVGITRGILASNHFVVLGHCFKIEVTQVQLKCAAA